MTDSFATPPLHLVLLAALAVIVVAISAALTLRALVADRRRPWRWALEHGSWAIGHTSRLLRWIGPKSALAIVASVAALVLFASVAEDVREAPTLAVDERLRALVQARRTAGLDQFFLLLTRLGNSSTLTVLVVATGALLALRRSRRTALLAMAGPFVASLAIIGFKQLFRRERPEGALALGVHTYSFPSGHSTGAAASLLTIAYVLAREHLVPWWSVAVAAVLVLLVGFSRVYLDAHWATDVAGGWAAGAGLALAGVALYERLRAVDRAKRMAEGQAPDAPAGEADARADVDAA